MLEENIRYNFEKQRDINEICAPLERAFGIKLIHYRRFYLKGGLISLFNHHDWMKISFEHEYWHSTLLLGKLQQLQHKNVLVYLWPSVPPNDKIYQGLYNCDLWNGVTIYKKYADCIESFAFASTRQNTQIINFYMAEIKILEHFILYFRSKILKLILGQTEKKIIIPITISINKETVDYNKRTNKFIQDTSINSFYYRIDGIDVKITKREEQCLSLLAKGKKTKEIANILGTSNRTIETHVDNARLKANACTTSNLINLYQALNH